VRRPAGILVSVLTGVVVALGVQAAPPVAAVLPVPAQVTGATIDVVIDSLSPLAPTNASILRVTGRVVNTSSKAMDDVNVRLRLSTAPLADRSQLAAVASAALGDTNTGRDDRSLDSTRIDLAPSLGAGKQATFAFSVPLTDLDLRAQGTYVISVEALGIEPGIDEFDESKGVQRTFLPWFPKRSEVTPIGLAWLWPLADWPARDAEGNLINAQTPQALSPGGRLHNLVDIGADQTSLVTWIADPALLQTAREISKGYQVRRDGELVVGDQSADADAWLAALAAAVGDSVLHTLPYADVDAGSSRRAGLQTDVVRSITQSRAIAAANVANSVGAAIAWAPGGRFDKQTANLVATSGATSVVLSSEAMPPSGSTGDPFLTPSGIADYGTVVGSINAILVDEGLARALGGPARNEAEIVLARQRFLAETALIASESSDGSGRVIVAGPPDVRWSPPASLIIPLLRATVQAPWLQPASLSDLLSAERVPRKRAPYGSAGQDAELSEQYLERVVASQRRLDTIVAILDNPSTIAPAFSEALLRAQSAAWRSQPKTGDQLLTAINAEIATRTALVQVLSTGTVIFSGDSGRVPVTIANDGDVAVTVGLALSGVPAARLVSEPLTDISVEPGHKVSVDLQARIIGGEPLTVKVQLLTPAGVSYGPAGSISLVSTAYSRAAGWVIAAAFLAIAVFVIVGITRRILGARRGKAVPPSGTVSS
jgi:hypothetical protein